MLELDAKKHGVASAAILVALLILCYAIFVQPAVSSRKQFHQRYDELQFQFSKLGDSNNKATLLKKELDVLGAANADTSGFFEFKQASLAAADIQKHLKTLVESSQASLISTQVIKQLGTDIFPQVTIKVHFRGNTNALKTVLYQLNSERPVLFIDNLLIQSRQRSRGGRAQRGGQIY